jgi:hypothetical protein
MKTARGVRDVITGLALLALFRSPLAGQTSGGVSRAVNDARSWTVPRAVDGHPDIEGVWNFATLTPLERPSRFAGKAFMTDQEAVEFERETLQTVNGDRRGQTHTSDLSGPAINEFWLERGPLATVNGRKPTSLIVDPPNGRIPESTVDAQTSAAQRAVTGRRFDGPEDFSLAERCLRSASGPPILAGAPDANFIRIVQARDHVAILQEKFHEVRLVSLDGRPHLPAAIRTWVGDSRGRWVGNTLSVDTTNFTYQLALGSRYDQNLHLMERFTRVGPNTLLYEFTVDDPTIFAKAWTVVLPMRRTGEQLYEFACHEGNYALPNILRGARFEEQVKKEAPNTRR